MDVDEVLARVERDLEAAEGQAQALHTKVEHLRTVQIGLRAAMDEYGLVAATSAQESVQVSHQSQPTGQWAAMSRTEAAERILLERGLPTEIGTVQRELHAQGRDDSQEQVRNALHYLSRIGKIQRTGRGMFSILAPPAQATEGSTAETVGPSVTLLRPEGGERSNASEESHNHHLAGRTSDGRSGAPISTG